MEQAKRAILGELDRIADTENINVIFACESGSRAWEFDSADSDYDIRFIYSKPINKYVTIGKEHSQLNWGVIHDFAELDFVGWDIKKTLLLYKNANPQLMEWLQAPVYKDTRGLQEMLVCHLPTFYDRRKCYHHYLGMAKNNWKEYILGRDRVRLKKYLYVIRSLWACHYATNIHKPLPIPIKFSDLRKQPNSPKPESAIDDLLKIKVESHTEMIQSGRVKEIDDYIALEIDRLEQFKEDWFEQHRLTGDQWREMENIRISQLDEILWKMVT